MLAAIAAALDVAGAIRHQRRDAGPARGGARHRRHGHRGHGRFQAQYPQSAWFGAIQPVEDTLREARRDALVAYLLGPGPAAAVRAC